MLDDWCCIDVLLREWFSPFDSLNKVSTLIFFSRLCSLKSEIKEKALKFFWFYVCFGITKTKTREKNKIKLNFLLGKSGFLQRKYEDLVLWKL